ncbi:hypothetical protein D3C78_1665510 [compost metagenome]
MVQGDHLVRKAGDGRERMLFTTYQVIGTAPAFVQWQCNDYFGHVCLQLKTKDGTTVLITQ